MPRFRDIPQFTRTANYSVHVGWDYLPFHYAHNVLDYGLNVCPDFQRGYVWTPEQKVRYVEYVLKGGVSGRDIYCNAPGWNSTVSVGDHVLVDGKQRLDAVLGFLNNEFTVFGGNYYRDYTDGLRITQGTFIWHVNDLQTYDEVLQWYLDLNSGGTVHSVEELDRVRSRLGQPYEAPPVEETRIFANLDRDVIRQAIAEEAARKAKPAPAAPIPPVKKRKTRP